MLPELLRIVVYTLIDDHDVSHDDGVFILSRFMSSTNIFADCCMHCGSMAARLNETEDEDMATTVTDLTDLFTEANGRMDFSFQWISVLQFVAVVGVLIFLECDHKSWGGVQ
jgi:hypothetical protein